MQNFGIPERTEAKKCHQSVPTTGIELSVVGIPAMGKTPDYWDFVAIECPKWCADSGGK